MSIENISNEPAVLSLKINTGTAGTDLAAIGKALDDLARPRGSNTTVAELSAQVKILQRELAIVKGVGATAFSGVSTSAEEAATATNAMANAANRATVSYRAIVDGFSVSARAQSDLNTQQVKNLNVAANAQKTQLSLGNDVVAMMRRKLQAEQQLGSAMVPGAYQRTAQYRAELQLGNEIVAMMRRKAQEDRQLASITTRSVSTTTRSAAAVTRHAGAIKNAGWETKGFTNTQNALHSALRGVGGTLGGLWLTYGKFVSVMIAAGAATKVFKDSVVRGLETDFSAQFVSILQTQGEFDKALKNQIRDTLISVSERSVFTTNENAEALKKLALAGIEASRGLKLLETASNAAIFSQTALGDATTMILDTLNNFALASDNSLIMADNFERVGNVMAFTANTVNASFSDIAKAFQNVTGVAGTFKIEIEEASVLLQSLARAGIRGQKSGTYLRNFLDDLLGAPTSEKAEKVLRKLEVDRYDADAVGEGDFGVARYIDNLIEKLRALDFVEQQNAIRAISNQRSRRVLRQELNEYTSVLDRTIALSKGAEGSLSRLAEGLGQNAQMSFRLAQAAYDASVTRAFAGNEDMFRQVGLDMQTLFKTDAFKSFADSGVSALGQVASAITTALKYLVEFKDGIVFMGNAALWAAVVFGVTKLSSALKLLTSTHPILLTITAVLTVGTALAQYVSDMEKAGKTLEGIDAKLKQAEESAAFLQERINEVRDGPFKNQQVANHSAQLASMNAVIEELKAQRDAVVDALRVSPEQIALVNNSLEELEKAYTERLMQIRQASRGAASGNFTVDFLNLAYVREELAALSPALSRAENEVAALAESILGKSEAYRLYQKYLADTGASASEQTRILGHVATAIFKNEAGYLLAAGSARLLADNIDNLREEALRLESVLVSSAISEAFKTWNENNPGEALKFSSSFFSGLETANDNLREQINLLREGEEGVFRQEQAYKRKELAALEAHAATLQASLLAVQMDGVFTSVLLTQLDGLRNTIGRLKENIDLGDEEAMLRFAGGIDKAAQEYDSLIERIQTFSRAQQEAAGQVSPLTEAQKLILEITSKYGNELQKLAPAQRRQVQALLQEAVASNAAAIAIENARKSSEAWTIARKEQVDSLRDSNAGLREKVNATQMEAESLRTGIDLQAEYRQAIAEVTAAQHEANAAVYGQAAAWALVANDSKALSYYSDLAIAAKDAAALIRQGVVADNNLEFQKKAKAARDDIEQEFKQLSENIERDLTDALMRGFESGKDFAENFRDTLRNMFKTLVLRPIIQAIIQPAAGQIAGVFGRGVPGGVAGGIGGVGGNPLSLLNSGKNLFSTVGQAISAGSIFGTASAYGGALGVSGAATGVGSQAAMLAAQTGSFGAAGLSATAGAASAGAAGAGIMSTVGAALPYIGAALAVGSMLAMRKTGERYAPTTAGGTGYIDPMTGRFTSAVGVRPKMSSKIGDPQWLGDPLADSMAEFLGILNSINQGFGNPNDVLGYDYTNRLRRTSGDFLGGLQLTKTNEGGSKTVDVASGTYKVDGDFQKGVELFLADVFSKGLSAGIGSLDISKNIKAIFEGVSGVEQTTSVLAALNALDQFKAGIDEMPAIFSKILPAVEEALATDNINAFSELSEFVDILNASTTAFYGAIIPEIERVGDSTRNFTLQLEKLGVGLPVSVAEFRALAEAIDTTTQEGRELFAAVTSLAPSFVELEAAILSLAGIVRNTVVASITDALLGRATTDQLSEAFQQVFVDGIRNVAANHTANLVTDLITSQIILPALNAMTMGKSVVQFLNSINLSVTLNSIKSQVSSFNDFMRRPDMLFAMGELNAAFVELAEVMGAPTNSATSAAQALAEAENQLRQSYQARTSELNQTISTFERFADSLSSFREGLLLSELSPLNPQDQYLEAKARFEQTASAANSGDEKAIAGLQAAATDFLKASRDMFASGDPYGIDFQKVLDVLNKTESFVAGEIDVAKASLKALDLQVGALIDINNSVMSVEDAIANLQAVLAAGNQTVAESIDALIWGLAHGFKSGEETLAQLQKAGVSVNNESWNALPTTEPSQLWSSFGGAVALSSSYGDTIHGIDGSTFAVTEAIAFIKDALARNDPHAVYSEAIKKGISANSLDLLMGWPPGSANQWAEDNDLPAFVSGGVHSGGLRLVGERGPELEVTGPAKYWSHDQTSALLAGSNPALVAEVRALRDEVRLLREQQAFEHADLVSSNHQANQGAAALVVEAVEDSSRKVELTTRYA